MFAAKRKRLGDLLCELKVISTSQLEQALEDQKITKERLGNTLIKLGFVTEKQIIEVLERQLGFRYVDIANMIISPEITRLVPYDLIERYQVLPISRDGKKIVLAMADPTNFYAIDDVHLASGLEVEAVIALESDIVRLIENFYGVQTLVDRVVKKIRNEDTQVIADTAEDAPIINIVNSFINQAIRENASDIHVEPQSDYVRIRYRIDGVLREALKLPLHTFNAVISRLKIMSEMDISEKRIPQDGRIDFSEVGRDIDLRVSSLPTIAGEKIVIRILDTTKVDFNINSLTLTTDNLSKLKKLYTQSHGMVLVTGPTGSGKSTTLYAVLRELNNIDRNIITIEDPVEYRLDGINQVHVNIKAGVTFASGLRSILRQDPNVVMIGEIRDAETMQIGVRSALTGQLVFSTLHTNNAPSAILRLLDMGAEPYLIASAVLGVIAQRLVRKVCPHCVVDYVPEPNSIERNFMGISNDEPVILKKIVGCKSCNNTGYSGRLAIHEIMTVTPTIRILINRSASSGEIATQAIADGMLTMRQDGINKARMGLTTIAEVIRVSYSDV